MVLLIMSSYLAGPLPDHTDNSIVFGRFAGKSFPAVKARTCSSLLCHAIHKLLEPGLACVRRPERRYGTTCQCQSSRTPGAGAHGESSRYFQQDDGRFCCNFRTIQQAQTRHSPCRHLKHNRTAAGHASSDGAIDVIRAIVLIPKSIPFRPHQLEEGGLVHNSFIARIVNGYVQVDQNRVCACSFLLADTVNDQSTVAQYDLLTTSLATWYWRRT